MSPRRALWSPTAPDGAVDGADGRESPTALAAQPGAPRPAVRQGSETDLQVGPEVVHARSALDAQVKLARLADALTELAESVREIARESLDLHAQRALMCDVETSTTPARLLSVRDVAERLNLSERTVRRLRQRGDLPRGIEVAGVVRWRPEEIDRWVAEGGRA